jgi:hypothetical protein
MKTLILTLVLSISLLAGCINKRHNYIGVLDRTISISPQTQAEFLQHIQRDVLQKMHDQDKFTLIFVDECSGSKADRVYTLDLAAKDFSQKSDGANNAEENARIRLRRFLMDTATREIAQAIQTESVKRQGCSVYTDIVNVMDMAGELVEHKKGFHSDGDKALNAVNGKDNYTYENSILLYSDMINENASHTLDFTKMPYMSKDEVDKKLKWCLNHAELPDLSGVKVFVYGATSYHVPERYADVEIQNIKQFWTGYFQAVHADLIAYGYDTGSEIRAYTSAEDDDN